MLDRNWHYTGDTVGDRTDGELDLVVRHDGVIVFAEVKARADERFGPAAAAVGPEKQRRLRHLALHWLAEHPQHRGPIRFDVVAVTGTRVEVLHAAF